MSHTSWYIKFRIIGILSTCIMYFFYTSLNLIVLIGVSFVLSLAIDSIVTSFTKIFKYRIIAVIITYILLIIFMLTGVVLIIPLVFTEITQIIGIMIENFAHIKESIQLLGIKGYIGSIERIPAYIKDIFVQYLSNPTNAETLQGILTQNISDIISTSSGYLTGLGGFAVGFVSNFFTVIFQIGLIIILSVFFSIEKDVVVGFLSSLTYTKYQEYTTTKINHLYYTMGLRLKGQLLLCIIIAVIVAIFLSILSIFGMRLDQILSLALIAGFTEFIPYIGPFLGSIPAVLIAGMLFGRKGILVVGLGYFCIQWLENNILIPWIMKKTIGINPLLIFLCMIIAGFNLGFVGIILAIPLAQVINLVYNEFMNHRE